jgi:pimeloyl-ACP methyl ester carboxylesterase
MPFVRSHGTEIYYESQGEGPAILLAHGGGGNAASWVAQAARANIEQS